MGVVDEEEIQRATPGAGVDPLVGSPVGNYRVKQEIGRGRTSQVYLAENVVAGKRAALKVLAPDLASNAELAQRFSDEARVCGGLKSPGMPHYYDAGTLQDGRPYTLTELVEGESIADRIRRLGPLPLEFVQQIVGQAALALSEAHEAGMLHRDIRPEHLIVSSLENGYQVKIVDFAPRAISGSESTFAAVYWAPEQVRKEPISPATDIYGLGATTFEMLTGRAPFVGEIDAVLAQKAEQDPELISTLRPGTPSFVDAVVSQMMQMAPEDRQTSMRAVADSVRSWTPDLAANDVAKMYTQSRLPWVLTTVVLVLAVGFGAWAFVGKDHKPKEEGARVAKTTPAAASVRASTPATATGEDAEPAVAEGLDGAAVELKDAATKELQEQEDVASELAASGDAEAEAAREAAAREAADEEAASEAAEAEAAREAAAREAADAEAAREAAEAEVARKAAEAEAAREREEAKALEEREQAEAKAIAKESSIDPDKTKTDLIIVNPFRKSVVPISLTEKQLKKAKGHFRKGKRLAGKGTLDRAYKQFEAGYKMGGPPLFLFNMAECAKQAKMTAHARAAYKAYLQLAPKGTMASKAKRRLAQL